MVLSTANDTIGVKTVSEEFDPLEEFAFESEGEYALSEEFEDDLMEFGNYETNGFDYSGESDEFLGGLLGSLGSILPKVAPIALNALGGLFGESEYEMEAEDSNDEINATTVPGLRPDNDVLSEQMAAEAAVAESEAEAQALAGAVPSCILSHTPTKIKKVAPTIIKDVGKITRALRKTGKGKRIVPVIANITKRTVATLVKKAQKGKPITHATASRVLAKQAKRVLTSPKKTAAALSKNKIKRKKLSPVAIARAEHMEAFAM